MKAYWEQYGVPDASKPQEYAKPVFSAEEVLSWLDRALAPVG